MSIVWGQSVLHDSDYVYLYGSCSHNLFVARCRRKTFPYGFSSTNAYNCELLSYAGWVSITSRDNDAATVALCEAGAGHVKWGRVMNISSNYYVPCICIVRRAIIVQLFRSTLPYMNYKKVGEMIMKYTEGDYVSRPEIFLPATSRKAICVSLILGSGNYEKISNKRASWYPKNLVFTF